MVPPARANLQCATVTMVAAGQAEHFLQALFDL
jgi:hypothetical protein